MADRYVMIEETVTIRKMVNMGDIPADVCVGEIEDAVRLKAMDF